MASTVAIPKSSAIVQVRLIDTMRLANHQPSIFSEPQIQGAKEFLSGPSFSFLIEHLGSKKYLFDLAAQKDVENLAPTVKDMMQKLNWDLKIDKDAKDFLDEEGIQPGGQHAEVESHLMNSVI
jgi:hypothetical protein